MQQDFPISASVLLLSSEGRSMFKNSTHVPVKAKSESSYITESKFNEIISDIDLLQELRKYFLLLTHFSDLTLQNYGVAKQCSEFA
jgi:dsDNA-specific endonuclease/ATPase MutS2